MHKNYKHYSYTKQPDNRHRIIHQKHLSVRTLSHSYCSQMQSQVNEIDSGGEKAYEVTEVRQTMEAVEVGPVLLVFGVLLTQFGVSFLIGAHSHLTSQTVFLLDLLHDQQALCGRRTEPLRVQTGHDHGHKEQTHLLRTESVREA